MSEPYAEIARKAANKLAETTDPQLPQLVEGVLAQGSSGEPPKQYEAATVIGLASLLVSMASLALTIYWNLKKNSSPPNRDMISRRVRVKIGDPKDVSTVDRDRMIDVVVEETIEYGKS